MKNEAIKKAIVIEAISKAIADKEMVRSYLKGEVSLKTITKKGIKLAKPL